MPRLVDPQGLRQMMAVMERKSRRRKKKTMPGMEAARGRYRHASPEMSQYISNRAR